MKSLAFFTVMSPGSCCCCLLVSKRSSSEESSSEETSSERSLSSNVLGRQLQQQGTPPCGQGVIGLFEPIVGCYGIPLHLISFSEVSSVNLPIGFLRASEASALGASAAFSAAIRASARRSWRRRRDGPGCRG